MVERIEDNSIPKNVPAFAKDMFVDNSNTAPVCITDQVVSNNASSNDKKSDVLTTRLTKNGSPLVMKASKKEGFQKRY